jgi:predicted dehydrogenase
MIEGWSHDINLIRGLLGPPRSILYATSGPPRLALVEWESTRVLFELGLLNAPPTSWDERLTFYGSAGRAEVVFPAPLLLRKTTDVIIRNGSGETRPTFSNREAFTEEMIHFLGCIKRQEPPLTNGRDALEDLELCKAIVDAAYATANL